MDIYGRIELLMAEAKEKPADLSRATGISTGLLTQWKQRKQKPSAEKIATVAEHYKVSLDFLIGNEPQQKEKPTAKSDELVNEIDQKIIDLLKKLNPRDKAAIMAQIDALANLPSDKED